MDVMLKLSLAFAAGRRGEGEGAASTTRLSVV